MTRPLAAALTILVIVVGVVILIVGLTGDSDDDSGGSAPPADGERREVEAPIESFELLILESFPQQYNVEIISGLPNGCHEFERYEVVRDGTDIEITVWNTIPAALDVACTEIYGTHRGTATLGSEFDSGTQYILTVGTQSMTFVAQ